MDYRKMSDFEINKMVAIILGKDLMPDDCQEFGLSGFTEVMLRSGDYKDYCNNPADAWPIIVDNSIGIKKQSNGIWVASRHGGMYPQYHENPLRAAMIVFLMMQESRP